MSVRIHIGDALSVLKTLSTESCHCCVTSPPYWGLRDYGTAAWIGGDDGCSHIAQRKPPVVGSSFTLGYPADGGPRRIAEGNTYHEAYTEQYRDTCRKCGATRQDSQLGLERTPEEFVAKMVVVFREVRRVLRDDGTLWLNLGDSYAAAPGGAQGKNGQVADRTAARLGIREGHIDRSRVNGLKPKDLIGIPWRLAFALQGDGWWLRSDIIWAKPNPMPESVTDRPAKSHEYVFLLSKSPRYYYDARAVAEDAICAGAYVKTKGNDGMDAGYDGHRTRDGFRRGVVVGPMRNRRSVWTIASKPYSEAHFATFPPALPEICIKAGCPVGGTVLDPFAGAGTTLLVAERLGRNGIGIELNPEYVALMRKRIIADAPLFASVEVNGHES